MLSLLSLDTLLTDDYKYGDNYRDRWTALSVSKLFPIELAAFSADFADFLRVFL